MKDCRHEDVTVIWRVIETGDYDKETHSVANLRNREWGFPEKVICEKCGHSFTEKELNELKVE